MSRRQAYAYGPNGLPLGVSGELPSLPHKSRKAKSYQSSSASSSRIASRNADLDLRISKLRSQIAGLEDKIQVLEIRKTIVPVRRTLTLEQKAAMQSARAYYKSLTPSQQLEYSRSRRLKRQKDAADARALAHVGERRLTKDDTKALRERGIHGFRAGKYVSEQTWNNLQTM